MDVLLGDVDMEKEKMKVKAQMTAPIELMTDFLVLVTEERIGEALALCDKILEYEPNNKMIKDYKLAMKEYVRQGLDEDEKETEGEVEDESEEEEYEDVNSEDEDEEEENREDSKAEPRDVAPPKGTMEAKADTKSSYKEGDAKEYWRR
jgi:hypothetical protein